jgi:hypothetical protein
MQIYEDQQAQLHRAEERLAAAEGALGSRTAQLTQLQVHRLCAVCNGHVP